ncbi:hypothetical protein D3C85_1620430 [compost metagenome]
MALAKAIVPAGLILAVVQVTRYVLAKIPGHHPGGLAAAAATVLETIGVGRWITLIDQLLVGCLATRKYTH